LTSRERILAAIGHRQPDRVPLDLGATPSSGISAVAYGRLKRHLGITVGRTRIYDVVQQLAQPEDVILDRFGVDVLDIGRAFNERDDAWRDVALTDGAPAQYPAWFHPRALPDGGWAAPGRDGEILAEMPAGGTFFDQSVFPYVDGYPDDLSDLDRQMGRVRAQSMGPCSRGRLLGRPSPTGPAPPRNDRPRPGHRGRMQPVRVGRIPPPHG